jgi:hypothetical protein
MIRNPTNEETIDMKMESGSMIRAKSRPRARGRRKITCPPVRAKGIRKSGRAAVAPPRSRDQAERADLEMRPARGIVKEPITGIKIVRRTMSSVLIMKKVTRKYEE